jgi:hypothetical protein
MFWVDAGDLNPTRLEDVEMQTVGSSINRSALLDKHQNPR